MGRRDLEVVETGQCKKFPPKASDGWGPDNGKITIPTHLAKTLVAMNMRPAMVLPIEIL